MDRAFPVGPGVHEPRSATSRRSRLYSHHRLSRRGVSSRSHNTSDDDGIVDAMGQSSESPDQPSHCNDMMRQASFLAVKSRHTKSNHLILLEFKKRAIEA